MKIAVLFDGAGLARLGLEQAGHNCTGYELDPMKHMLSKHVGSGNSILADVREVDLSGFDAVWASPPCQWHSSARTSGDPTSPFALDLLEWSLELQHPILWVENVSKQGKPPEWGTLYNAAQFLEEPLQNRNRIIGGRYKAPRVFRPYVKFYPGISPAVMATEYKGCKTDKRRAARFFHKEHPDGMYRGQQYNSRAPLEWCAEKMGFTVPDAWYEVPKGIKPGDWTKNLYEAIGNGVPVYMARAFGEAYESDEKGWEALLPIQDANNAQNVSDRLTRNGYETRTWETEDGYVIEYRRAK